MFILILYFVYDVDNNNNSNYTYNERLTLLNLPSLELRRLRLDLIWCYKILFGLISIDSADQN